MPGTFKVSGIYIRNKHKREEFSQKYNAPIFEYTFRAKTQVLENSKAVCYAEAR